MSPRSPSAGSRLPAPPAWLLLEPWHPSAAGDADDTGGAADGGAAAAEGIAAALTWLLGLEASGSAYLAAIPTGDFCSTFWTLTVLFSVREHLRANPTGDWQTY